MTSITADLLRRAVGCSQDDATRFAPFLAVVCETYGINTPARLAAFLAQIGHESVSFKFVREIASGAAYEGRADLGNTRPGDGERYRGRGLIQVTGRANYRALTERLRARLGVVQVPNFEDTPVALEDTRWAALSAGDYWDSHGLNALADIGDFKKITKKINGGLTGLDDRLARWEKAKQAIAVAPEEQAQQPQQPAPEPETPTAYMPAGEGGPDEQPAPAPKGTPMPSVSDVVDSPLTKFALAAINPLLGAVPELVHLFIDKSTGQTVPERNAAAVVKMVSVAQQALQAAGHDAPNEQAVAQAVTSDPAAKALVRDALMANYYQIAVGEAGGGGIDGARKANAVYAQPGAPGFWLNPSFWISVILIAMPMMLLVDVFYVHPQSYIGELRTQIVTGVLMVIGMVGGYWIGTSISSAKKDEKAQA